MPVTPLRNELNQEEDQEFSSPCERTRANVTMPQASEMALPSSAASPHQAHQVPCWCGSPRCSCARCGMASNRLISMEDPDPWCPGKGSPSYNENLCSWESTPSYASDHRPVPSCSSSSSPRNSEPLMLPLQAVASQVSCGDYDHRDTGVAGLDVYMLYASPLDFNPLNIRAEVEAIREAFRDARSGVRLHVGVATAASLTKLLTLSRLRKGLVLHLIAHAVSSSSDGVGLVLEDGKGKSHILWQRELEDLLHISEAEEDRHNLSMLFLGACKSEALAQVFVECGCPHVISLRTQVQDAAARRFAQQFYLSLAVQESLRAAWDGARRALRVDADRNMAAQADSFLLFGQQGSEQATLHTLCGADSSSCTRGASAGFGMPISHIRDFEDADAYLEMKLPARPQDFVGRGEDLRKILHVLSSRRVCVVHGPEGIGKSALVTELAHYAASPGRPFSCAARIANIDSAGLDRVVAALEEAALGIGDQMRVSHRQWSGDSRMSIPSSARSTASAFSSFSDASVLAESCRDIDPLSALLPARQRLRRVLQAVERARRGSRLLLIIEDDVGALSQNDEVRRLLGELLEHTHNLHLVICSREPMYTPLGPTKAVNVQLRGLAEPDAARLLLLRIHRPLGLADFSPLDCLGDGCSSSPALQGPPETLEQAMKSLRGHPLLRRLGGNPGHLSAVSSQVHEGGPSLMELALTAHLLPGVGRDALDCLC